MQFTQKLKASFFPFLSWWPKVNASTLKSDILAAITGAIIVLPQGVAFALIAGLPPEYGLYTAMITPIIAALFGSSWQMVSGPTTALSIVVFTAVSELGYEPFSAAFIETAIVLTLLAGIIQLILGIARMGTLVNFVSHSVVIGFTAGAAVLIAGKQLKYIVDIDPPKGASFFQIIEYIGMHIGQANTYAVIIGLVTLVIAVLTRKFIPKLPYMLVAMFGGSVLNILIDGQAHGVKLINEITASFPSYQAPNLSWDSAYQLSSSAFTVALLGLVSAVAIGRSIATVTHQHLNSNQEFIGQGLSNIVGSFFMCYMSSGSFTRSGVNHQAGAKTPLSAIFASIFLLILVALLARYITYLPMPAMGGIIMLVGYNLIDFKHIRSIMRSTKSETIVLFLTMGAALFFKELEYAIYLGVFFSLVFYLQKTSKPRIVSLVADDNNLHDGFANVVFSDQEEHPHIQIARIDGALYFGAVNHVANTFFKLSEKPQRFLVLDLSGVEFIDMSGAEFILTEAKRWEANGGGFYLVTPRQKVRDFMKKGTFDESLGFDKIYHSKQEAIASINLSNNYIH